MKYIDLTHPITPTTPNHPYDEPMTLVQHKHLNKDGFNDTKLTTSMHVGTHMDVPRHLTSNETMISEYPIDSFIGKGILLDVLNESIISFKEEYKSIDFKDTFVFFYTGYDSIYGTEEYYTNHPVIDLNLISYLIQNGIKMIGLDTPSPDYYPFEIHQLLFKNNIFIIENLCNLNELKSVKDFEIIALPLKIEAEASPIRVIAKINQ